MRSLENYYADNSTHDTDLEETLDLFFHMLLRNFTTDNEESSYSLLRSHYKRTEHCFSHSSDMLKFLLLSIVLILCIRESVMNSREKRFLIFPRGNPTRHQVRRNPRMQKRAAS